MQPNTWATDSYSYCIDSHRYISCSHCSHRRLYGLRVQANHLTDFTWICVCLWWSSSTEQEESHCCKKVQKISKKHRKLPKVQPCNAMSCLASLVGLLFCWQGETSAQEEAGCIRIEVCVEVIMTYSYMSYCHSIIIINTCHQRAFDSRTTCLNCLNSLPLLQESENLSEAERIELSWWLKSLGLEKWRRMKKDEEGNEQKRTSRETRSND